MSMSPDNCRKAIFPERSDEKAWNFSLTREQTAGFRRHSVKPIFRKG